jgi:hypothetical protein
MRNPNLVHYSYISRRAHCKQEVAHINEIIQGYGSITITYTPHEREAFVSTGITG